ncbi:hypothetical protein AKJ49_00590 [candidate division MSBL1 archaeon SCGC-AAA382A03]|uniref:Uncharacterized protein n=1 Tax=candidate division MSBL1 archaeon SCGC-AAA382A03 TaxID=1698278 RepID=A0A133VGE4_9EURY|nr:hypothetical protein AKJ49_00590 [candidate division MSBL1 archaeon SCGC-AAA382A03]
MVTWLSWGQRGEGNWIYAKRFDSSGSPQSDNFLVSDNPADYQEIPSLVEAEDLEFESEPEQINIAGDENGNFVIVWVFENEDSRGIRARLYDNTAKPKSEIFQVNTEEDVQGEISVSMNNAGDFIISWMGESGDGNVFAKVYNSSGEVRISDFQVSNYPKLKQGYPSAGIDEDGSFVIAWETGVSEGGQSQDGDKTGISARRFNADGIASGDEFQVNQHWRDWQEETGAAIHNGLFVVTWMSTEVDGDADDISARLFNDS